MLSQKKDQSGIKSVVWFIVLPQCSFVSLYQCMIVIEDSNFRGSQVKKTLQYFCNFFDQFKIISKLRKKTLKLL